MACWTYSTHVGTSDGGRVQDQAQKRYLQKANHEVPLVPTKAWTFLSYMRPYAHNPVCSSYLPPHSQECMRPPPTNPTDCWICLPLRFKSYTPVPLNTYVTH
ncbi:Syncytin-1 [Plecturocebus cupreus]